MTICTGDKGTGYLLNLFHLPCFTSLHLLSSRLRMLFCAHMLCSHKAVCVYFTNVCTISQPCCTAYMLHNFVRISPIAIVWQGLPHSTGIVLTFVRYFGSQEVRYYRHSTPINIFNCFCFYSSSFFYHLQIIPCIFVFLYFLLAGGL